jgi:hypothetical protein
MVMKRFYIKRVGDHVSIVHRPTHQIIMMGNMNEEMGKQIKRFIKMGTEEFYKELISLGLRFKTSRSILEEPDKEREDWYEKAWIYTTNQVLGNYKIELDSIPEEEVPLELIKKLQTQESKGWNINAKEETKEETKEVKVKPKKVLKKKTRKLPKRVSNEKVVSLGGYKDLKELEEAYRGGELSTREYIKLKRKLS